MKHTSMRDLELLVAGGLTIGEERLIEIHVESCQQCAAALTSAAQADELLRKAWPHLRLTIESKEWKVPAISPGWIPLSRQLIWFTSNVRHLGQLAVFLGVAGASIFAGSRPTIRPSQSINAVDAVQGEQCTAPSVGEFCAAHSVPDEPLASLVRTALICEPSSVPQRSSNQ
jgi:hypothetical protein